MAKVYSWEISNGVYAYIVDPNNTDRALVSRGEITNQKQLQIITDWTQNATDTEYDAQFEKMLTECANRGYSAEFEDASAYRGVTTTCNNLRGPAGRGISTIEYLRSITEDDGTYSVYTIKYDDGTNGTLKIREGRDGKDGINGEPGAPGDSGVSSKLIMIYTSGVDADGNIIIPDRPQGGSYDFISNEFVCPDGWLRNDGDDGSLTPPIWRSTRTFASTEASTDRQWSNPVQITGESGAPGEDGISTEFIYFLGSNPPRGEALPSENIPGFVPDESWGTTASPEGIDERNKTEYCYTRTKNKETGVWGGWNGPTIWSKYGENGQDGDGVQYIFLKNKGQVPHNPTPFGYDAFDTTDPNIKEVFENYQNKDTEWLPPTGYQYTNLYGSAVTFTAIEELPEGSDKAPAGIWSDDPSDVGNEFQFIWVSSRKYRKSQESGKKMWTKFSDPTLWAKFGQDGKNATSIRRLYKLTSSTGSVPDLPEDPTMTADWGTGFPKDYKYGENVVWATEAEIWAHNFEFVMSYRKVSDVDKDGNVIPPKDATEENSFVVPYIPDSQNGYEGIVYLVDEYDGHYYKWDGGWCEPFLITGVKGDPGDPIDYNTYVFAFGYTDYPPTPPTGNSPTYPGESAGENGILVQWRDFPDTSLYRDGIQENGIDMRWFQCEGQVDGYTKQIKIDDTGKLKWGAVTPCNPRDGEGKTGPYYEFRFGITKDDKEPPTNFVIDGAWVREPEYYIDNEKYGWFDTDDKMPAIPEGGAMWQIWALIDHETNAVLVVGGKGWNGPRRISGEKGERGLQGPAGLRGVSGLPGAAQHTMYCLGTYGKDKSEYYFDIYTDPNVDKVGDGYFGDKDFQGKTIEDLEKKGWYSNKNMPYSDVIKVVSDTEFRDVYNKPENQGRVIRYIRSTADSANGRTFTNTTHQYYLVGQGGGYYTQLTGLLTEKESEEFDIYVWCIQGNDKWSTGKSASYKKLTSVPEDANDNNTQTRNDIPATKVDDFKYLRDAATNEYYMWVEIDGGSVEHIFEGIEWSSPFKLQGTNGLRGLAGNRGQVVYPMGIYNHEEIYITTETKAPYVYDPNDGLFYVYNIVGQPWIGKLPENYKEVMIDMDGDGNTEYYKYSSDGSGNEGTWYTIDQDGDTPANNFANAGTGVSPAWVRLESFQALYTNIGIIANGMIGSAVYNNEFMFSQQGINKQGEKTNYAVVSGKPGDNEDGFLSGYEFDEKGYKVSLGENKGYIVLHWKYKNTPSYINDTAVNPYEKDENGNYIHAFMPNVCINFSTGQMWLQCGKLRFGQVDKDTNVYTQEEVDKNVGDVHNEITAATQSLSNAIAANKEEILKQIDKRADSYYQDADPSIEWQTTDSSITATYAEYRVGDLWYDTGDKKSYIFAKGNKGDNDGKASANSALSDYFWAESEVSAEIYNAINGKSKIFIEKPVPPYFAGDLWFVENNSYQNLNFVGGTGITSGTCMVCLTTNDSENAQFRAGDWGRRDRYADEAQLNAAQKELEDMTRQLDDWDNDGLLSPAERKILESEYDSIVAEYESIIDQAKDVSLNSSDTNVTTTAHYNAYTTYTGTTETVKNVLANYYLKPENATATTSSDGTFVSGGDCVIIVTGTTDTAKGYGWIKKYYEDRQILLACISEKLNNNITIVHNEITAATQSLSNAIAANKDEILKQVDKRADSYYQDADPSNVTNAKWQTTDSSITATYAEYRLGDLWYDTGDKKSYTFAKKTNGTMPTAGKESANSALSAYYWAESDVPASVYSSIKGRSKIFVSQPAEEYHVGDLWFLEKDYTAKFYGCTKAETLKSGTIMVAVISGTTYDAGNWGRRDRYADEAELVAAQAELVAMDAKLTDWASDNKINESERTALKRELDTIKAEFPSITGQATTVGVLTSTAGTNYQTAYTNAVKVFNYYITAETDTNGCVDIVSGTTDTTKGYGWIKNYYEKRQALLQVISDKLDGNIKDVSDKTLLAIGRLDAFGDDNYISPEERKSLKETYDGFSSEYTSILNQAKTLDLSGTTEYTNYHNFTTYAESALKYYSSTANTITDSDSKYYGFIQIVNNGTGTTNTNGYGNGAQFYGNIAEYYKKKDTLQQKITEKLNTKIDNIEKPELADNSWLINQFEDGTTEFYGGAIISNILTVKNDTNEAITGFINGSDNKDFKGAKDSSSFIMLGLGLDDTILESGVTLYRWEVCTDWSEYKGIYGSAYTSASGVSEVGEWDVAVTENEENDSHIEDIEWIWLNTTDAYQAETMAKQGTLLCYTKDDSDELQKLEWKSFDSGYYNRSNFCLWAGYSDDLKSQRKPFRCNSELTDTVSKVQTARTKIYNDGVIETTQLIAPSGFFGGEIESSGIFTGKLEVDEGTLTNIEMSDSNISDSNFIVNGTGSLKVYAGQNYTGYYGYPVFKMDNLTVETGSTKESAFVDSAYHYYKNSNGNNDGQWYGGFSEDSWITLTSMDIGRNAVTASTPQMTCSYWIYTSGQKTAKNPKFAMRLIGIIDSERYDTIYTYKSFGEASFEGGDKKGGDAYWKNIIPAKSGIKVSSGYQSIAIQYQWYMHLHTYAWLSMDKSAGSFTINPNGGKIEVDYGARYDTFHLGNNGLSYYRTNGKANLIISPNKLEMSRGGYGIKIDNNGIYLSTSTSGTLSYKKLTISGSTITVS